MTETLLDIALLLSEPKWKGEEGRIRIGKAVLMTIAYFDSVPKLRCCREASWLHHWKPFTLHHWGLINSLRLVLEQCNRWSSAHVLFVWILLATQLVMFLGCGSSLNNLESIYVCAWPLQASLVAQMLKNLPAMQATRVPSLGREDSPGEENGNPL